MSETIVPAAAAEDRFRDVEEALGRRIEQLEQENQRMRRITRTGLIGVGVAFGVSLVVLAVFGTGGSSALSADTVEATRFVLRDPGGREQGEWVAAQDGSSRFVLRDSDGRERLRLSLQPDGATGVSFTDDGGRARAALALLPDQTANLVFADRGGRTRAVLGYSPDEDAFRIAFGDGRGEERAWLGVAPSGQPGFSLTEDRPAAAPAEAAGDPETP